MPSMRFIASPDQPRTADVVIIGGGPAGTAALWAIDRAAPGTHIVLIEHSDRLAAGSSAASLEAFRMTWPCLPLARQMQRSIEIFHHADEYLGEGAAQSLALRQHGYLFCAFNQQQLAAFRSDTQRLHEIGLTHIELLDAAEVQHCFGWVGPKVIGAKFDPIAGWLDSNALVHRFASQAARAHIILSIERARICVEGGQVRGVETPYGLIAASRVVIASGANARAVGRTAGVDLPLMVRPRQSFTSGWRHPDFPADGPLLIGSASFPHVRPEAQVGATFGWEYAWRSKHLPAGARAHPSGAALLEPLYPVELTKDRRFPSLALMLLARQFGHKMGQGFADPRYLRSLHHNAGYYVYRDERAAYRSAPDGARHPYESERAIIDTVPGVEGLVVSVAHVGHGIMSAPAGGEIAACKVLGLPLPDPSFAAFGFDVPWVEYDEAVL